MTKTRKELLALARGLLHKPHESDVVEVAHAAIAALEDGPNTAEVIEFEEKMRAHIGSAGDRAITQVTKRELFSLFDEIARMRGEKR